MIVLQWQQNSSGSIVLTAGSGYLRGIQKSCGIFTSTAGSETCSLTNRDYED
jgi:hypothetical protein